MILKRSCEKICIDPMISWLFNQSYFAFLLIAEHIWRIVRPNASTTCDLISSSKSVQCNLSTNLSEVCWIIWSLSRFCGLKLLEIQWLNQPKSLIVCYHTQNTQMIEGAEDLLLEDNISAQHTRDYGCPPNDYQASKRPNQSICRWQYNTYIQQNYAPNVGSQSGPMLVLACGPNVKASPHICELPLTDSFKFTSCVSWEGILPPRRFDASDRAVSCWRALYCAGIRSVIKLKGA